MMDLANEIRKAYNGDSWHGANIMYLLSSATPEQVFAHPVPNAHSIAELVAHLTAWTEEAADRIAGKQAKIPLRGDWPEIYGRDHATWNVLLDDFSIANERLIALCGSLKKEDWEQPVKDERNSALGTGVNYMELVTGLLQHHAYHAGQMALLLKF